MCVCLCDSRRVNQRTSGCLSCNAPLIQRLFFFFFWSITVYLFTVWLQANWKPKLSCFLQSVSVGAATLISNQCWSDQSWLIRLIVILIDLASMIDSSWLINNQLIDWLLVNQLIINRNIETQKKTICWEKKNCIFRAVIQPKLFKAYYIHFAVRIFFNFICLCQQVQIH